MIYDTLLKRLNRVVEYLRQRSVREHYKALKRKPIADRIVYAAYSRCPCGAGLAYDPAGGPHGYWDCSDILLDKADEAVIHTDKLPFTFWSVKSENQPSANGATTREKK